MQVSNHDHVGRASLPKKASHLKPRAPSTLFCISWAQGSNHLDWQYYANETEKELDKCEQWRYFAHTRCLARSVLCVKCIVLNQITYEAKIRHVDYQLRTKNIVRNPRMRTWWCLFVSRGLLPRKDDPFRIKRTLVVPSHVEIARAY